MQERQDLLERISVIDGLLRLLGVEQQPEDEVEELSVDVPRLTLTRAAEEILREAAGEPMHGHEVLKRAKAMGVRVGGRNPKNTFFGTLNRKPDLFVNVGGNRWILAEFRTGGADAEDAEDEDVPTDERSDYRKCLDALSAIGRPTRVADITRRLAGLGTPIPEKSVRSYIGRAHRAGKISKIANGLYAAKDSAPSDEGGA